MDAISQCSISKYEVDEAQGSVCCVDQEQIEGEGIYIYSCVYNGTTVRRASFQIGWRAMACEGLLTNRQRLEHDRIESLEISP